MAPRGDIYDRMQTMEARVADLERQLKLSLRGDTVQQWPAAGTTVDVIASGEVGEVQLVNQFTGMAAGKIRAKNPYTEDLPADLFVSVFLLNGILMILTGDCPS